MLVNSDVRRNAVKTLNRLVTGETACITDEMKHVLRLGVLRPAATEVGFQIADSNTAKQRAAIGGIAPWLTLSGYDSFSYSTKSTDGLPGASAHV